MSNRNQTPARGAKKNDRDGAATTRSRATGPSWLQQHQLVAVDSLLRLLREPGASLLTWSVIGIALALPLCLLLLLQNLQQVNTGVDAAGDISVYMALDADDGALQNALNAAAVMTGVANVTLVTAAEALQEFQATSGYGNVLEGLEENPLPAVLVVTPATTDAATAETLVTQLQLLDAVDTVQVDLAWVQRLNSIVQLARRITSGLALLLGLGVILAIGNTVRLAIENRRDEILVVKLVGGTDSYVSRPFLYTGLWYGVGGGLVALLLVLGALLFLGGPLARLVVLYGSEFTLSGISASAILVLLAIAGALGLAGAWLSVLRHLRHIEPR